MKTKYKHIVMVGLAPVMISGCASLNQGKNVTVSPSQTLMPGMDSQVGIDVNFNIPRHTFSKRSRLIIVPQLVSADTMIAECDPVVLDASIYNKKNERRKKLSSYVDVYGAKAVKTDTKEDVEIRYTTSVAVPQGFNGGKVMAVLSTDGCGECEVADTVDMAYVSDISSLASPVANIMSLDFVIRLKTVEGRGEALIRFDLGKHDINLSLGNNEKEMNGMLSNLSRIMTDTLARMRKLSIYAMASADGPYSLNSRLAKERASSAAGWLMDRIPSSSQYKKIINVEARPEGWASVVEAMKADGNKEADAVEQLMLKYQDKNDDVAERYIRKLDCWEEIKAKYLQGDRKVVYEYQYSLKSFTTDHELLEMYNKRPDAFNEDEMLKVATLMETDAERVAVYRKALGYFPQSQVAANNLALILMDEGKTDEALEIISSLDTLSTVAANTKAALLIGRGEYTEAVEMIESRADSHELRYNQAIAEALRRNYAKAYSLMDGVKDSNAALIALCAGHPDEALAIMKECGTKCVSDEYVMSLVYARLGMEEEMWQHLEKACCEEKFRKRAAAEADFMPYSESKRYREIVND